ncbi:MAG TPA: hypothetical protein VKB88_04995 [Bryobacteraceae bacterium]|nr:hypothetical protein [Bryobacteraceae bacterium]
MWCSVTGVAESGNPCSAMACLIEDSGDGACHLVFGGAWGLRLKTGDRDWDPQLRNGTGLRMALDYS